MRLGSKQGALPSPVGLFSFDSLILRSSESFEVSPAFRQHFSQLISGSSPGITCKSTLRILHAFDGSLIRAPECGIIRTLVSYIDQIWEYLILNFTIALMLFVA
ncbi:hypothetical protein EYC55_00350 [Xanthomonas oryzae]|nr:hypothetical protein EYC54_00340 [Xanthomonas oryzae]QBG94279.1 hypothetical protein EYC55_00350 [Xanthomonas oryzae]QBG98205.1 hypothetical protein EYC56_00345 [Xanthomonas oryzae]QBH02233.1 hypothetical protein EYC57_00330 [Xanthomonas oryzae]